MVSLGDVGDYKQMLERESAVLKDAQESGLISKSQIITKEGEHLDNMSKLFMEIMSKLMPLEPKDRKRIILTLDEFFFFDLREDKKNKP